MKPIFSKKRRIGMTRSSNNGFISTEKNLTDGEVEFESELERKFADLHIHGSHCLQIESQPLEIPGAKGRPYYPDFGVKYDDGEVFIYDIKFKSEIDEMKEYPVEWQNWITRKKIIKNYCLKHGYKYEIITDEDFLNERYENVEFFGRNKYIPDNLMKIKPIINTILEKEGEMILYDLAELVSKKARCNMNLVFPCINHLVYHDHFMLDFESKIDDTTVLKL
ncbi:MAG: Tn7 transposase TnsA N-terminal domain-containing protein [Promethearchaeota archaeon]